MILSGCREYSAAQCYAGTVEATVVFELFDEGLLQLDAGLHLS